MANTLAGRTALVTGGARRIGRAITLALAGAGVNVIIHYRSSEPEAREPMDEARRLGSDAWVLQADFSTLEQVDSLIDRAIDAAGQLDMLINNASAYPFTDFETLDFDQLLENIKTDAWAPFVLGRKFAQRVGRGSIINILDTRITDFDWRHVSYSASKYLLGHFTRMMAIKFAPNITVNAVAPGLILPPEGKGLDYLEALKDTLPLKKVGSPEEVADAVLYLARSEFVTGQVIFVDGGRHVREGLCG